MTIKTQPRIKMDFSQLNLQYLMQARDLTRQDAQFAELVLGIPHEMARLLSGLPVQQLTPVINIKPPLVMPRQEPWWWSRLSSAIQSAEPEEIEAIIDHASLISSS